MGMHSALQFTHLSAGIVTGNSKSPVGLMISCLAQNHAVLLTI
jgi:hypothetical protein